MTAPVPDPGRSYVWSCRVPSASDIYVASAGLFNTGTAPIDITRVNIDHVQTSSAATAAFGFELRKVSAWSGGIKCNSGVPLDTASAALPSTVGWYLHPQSAGNLTGDALRGNWGPGIYLNAATSWLNRNLPATGKFLTSRGGTTPAPIKLREGEAVAIVVGVPAATVPQQWRVGCVVRTAGNDCHTFTALAGYDMRDGPVIGGTAAAGQAPVAIFANPTGSGVVLDIVDLWIIDAARPYQSGRDRWFYLAIARGYDMTVDGDALDVTSSIMPLDPGAARPAVKAIRGPFDPYWQGEDFGQVVTDNAPTGLVKRIWGTPPVLLPTDFWFPRADRRSIVHRGIRRSDCGTLRLQPGRGLVLSVSTGTKSYDQNANFEVEFTVTRPRKYPGVRGVVEGVPL